ncbi:MAG: hypothetical protein ACYDGR_00230 [Candidatus Dormibacteria bacterium]
MSERSAAFDQYSEAEAAYLAGLRAAESARELAALARAAHLAASAWSKAAYAEFFELRARLGEAESDVIELEIDAERSELVAEIWRDISRAQSGDSGPLQTY